MGRDGGEAPRFDLRFEAGHGLLRLARPLGAGVAVLEELVLSLGRVSFPLDVTAGPGAFRNRRTAVRRARFSLDPRLLVRATAALGANLTITPGPSSGLLSLGVRDDFGVVAADVTLLVDGADLFACVRDVRCAVDGPATPWRRLFSALRLLGVELDEARGLLVLRRPTFGLFAEALVSRGWRLPSTARVELALPRAAEGCFVLELGTVEAAPDAAVALDVEEEARLCAPVLARLSHDDLDAAVDALAAVCRRVADRPAIAAALRDAVVRIALACEVDRPGEEEAALRHAEARGPEDRLGCAVRLRLALRAGDLSAAALAADQLARVEPVAELACEALAVVAGALVDSDPARANALIRRAVSRRPRSAELAVLWVELAERAGDVEAVEEAARRALAAALPSAERARVASAAARSFERLSQGERAERLWQEALFASPDDPRALEGLAGLHARRGDRAEAVIRLDRAARAWEQQGDPSSASATLLRAAELLVGADKLSAAEHRMERAVDLAPERPELHCAVARLRVSMGAVEAACRAYEDLLALEERAPESLAHALVEAASFHLDDREDPEAAAPFVELLHRLRPDDERLPALAERAAPELLGGAPPALELEEEILSGLSRRAPGARAGESRWAPFEDDALEGVIEEGEEVEEVDELGVTSGVVEAPPFGGQSRGDDPESLREVSDELRRAGKHGAAALALARAGLVLEDAATLRAALSLAERHGAWLEALEVIELALSVVGDGPARGALLARREEIEARLDD